jgi:hypothetical protein
VIEQMMDGDRATVIGKLGHVFPHSTGRIWKKLTLRDLALVKAPDGAWVQLSGEAPDEAGMAALVECPLCREQLDGGQTCAGASPMRTGENGL